MATIVNRICELAAQQLEVEENSLSMDTDLDSLARNPEDFGWWIRFIEREWGIKISEEEQLSLNALGELIALVQEKVKTPV